MKSILILALALSLTGCANLKGAFANRAACTVSGQQLLVASMYGPIGIVSKIDAADSAAICQKAP